jgi:hypothetical protein
MTRGFFDVPETYSVAGALSNTVSVVSIDADSLAAVPTGTMDGKFLEWTLPRVWPHATN